MPRVSDGDAAVFAHLRVFRLRRTADALEALEASPPRLGRVSHARKARTQPPQTFSPGFTLAERTYPKFTAGEQRSAKRERHAFTHEPLYWGCGAREGLGVASRISRAAKTNKQRCTVPRHALIALSVTPEKSGHGDPRS